MVMACPAKMPKGHATLRADISMRADRFITFGASWWLAHAAEHFLALAALPHGRHAALRFRRSRRTSIGIICRLMRRLFMIAPAHDSRRARRCWRAPMPRAFARRDEAWKKPLHADELEGAAHFR